MQPTVYASFTNAELAERTVGALLEQGVSADDLSLIVYSNGQGQDPEHAVQMIDSGEAGAPVLGQQRDQREGSYLYESQVGGGIETSERNDSVSSVDEMDNAQEAAEDMIYPESGASFGRQEGHDVMEATHRSFFNTTRPGDEGLGTGETLRDDMTAVEESELRSLMVPGVGLVLGGGALATNLIGVGIATERGGNPADSMSQYLIDEGVELEQARGLIEDFESQGAIVSISVPPGTVNGEAVMQVLESSGARNVHLVG
jgi:hypothetical protein